MGINALQGKQIVIAGSRKTDEMCMVIEKQGGVPIVRSLQGLTMFDEALLEEPLRNFAEQGADWVILTTGMGSDQIVNTADSIGIKQAVLGRLAEAKIATRGYKTSAFLKRSDLKAIVSTDDGTMDGLIENLEAFDFEGQRVWIQLHGEPAPKLVHFLENKGASQIEAVLPYKHVPPDAATVELLLSELSAGTVDTVCFTTAVQVHYLFKHAIESGRKELLLNIFNQHIVAAAVGKVTAAALKEYGVERIIVPELERMGALVIEIGRYYERTEGKEV
ncbi:uroporphyrinogen-III synthase [Paenibacillus sp. FSL A5-0031]|uniref:uroporphyrinogen-III synthase n=1 Tax=Paenibacillus sp. FSL A5-0031 TaxID=1920420 RepID=UPI00096E0D1E|nr:uroporphyrinogen-III synthase [Paenibacillus sp. FSL A5-0031]OME78292.1 uroporphyrinogen-III synthase [Paenibacillus sp. FSL A5-0031]